MRDIIRFVIVINVLLFAAMATGADLQKGLAALETGDYETALAECLPLAEDGDADAQFCVGKMYANGFGVAMDDAQALKWYGLAATAGQPKALYNLGIMHANGWGVDMNDEKAVEFYTQAAEKGHTCAQRSLAYVVGRGIGIDENAIESYTWYYIAAELGDTESHSMRDEIAEGLPEQDRQLAEAEARKWLAKFEAQGLHASSGQ